MRWSVSMLFVLVASLGAVGESTLAQTCPAPGDCLVPHPTGGCNDASCCATVCAQDTICCTEWDAGCVAQADLLCVGLCGANAGGACSQPNGLPACENRSCCEATCVIAPFCCDVSWDSTCVIIASGLEACSTSGPGCGDPSAGSCTEANGTPSCADAACCETVCAIRAECCTVFWDAICASIATTACSSDCEIPSLPGDVQEVEGCGGGDSNDACDGGQVEFAPLDVRLVGTFINATDRDAYELDLAELDEDGDGLVQLRVDFLAKSARLSFLQSGCGSPAILDLDSSGCISNLAIQCVPATGVLLVVEPTDAVSACDGIDYAMTIEAQDFCGPPCENPSGCLDPHAGPGCEDGTCCDAVCAVNSACCAWVWDAACASLAAELCGGPPPVNDDCQAATPAPLGVTAFRQLLATTDGPDVDCVDDDYDGDVWFTHRVECDGLMVISTCGPTDFDNSLEVFRGTCDGLERIGCNDDVVICPSGAAELRFKDLVCGDDLLIRVTGLRSESGTGSLEIGCLANACGCRGDVTGDGRVDGADFGVLLQEWGPCGGSCLADFDGNDVVDGGDLGEMLLQWGDC